MRYLTWYETMVYARWRGAMLLSEAQWEKAARGGLQIPNPQSQIELVDNPNPERRFPWGDEFDKNKCNTSESGIGNTTPVGRYSPRGDSPYGLADMAGNVWERTSSAHLSYPYRPDDGREDLEGWRRRMLRGGSFHCSVRSARCSRRDPLVPDGEWSDDGCRVGWCADPALPWDSGF